MTEQNSLTRGYSSQDVNEDDPLEELARIVSGQGRPAPRPAARTPEPASAQHASPAPGRHAADAEAFEPAMDEPEDPLDATDAANDDDDFSFDLESELMRELEGPAAASHPAWDDGAGEPADEAPEEPDMDGEAVAEIVDEAGDEGSLEDQLLAELGFSGFDSDAEIAAAAQELLDEAGPEHSFEVADEEPDQAEEEEPQAERASGDDIDLEREFQETFEAELAVGRAANALARAAEDDAEANPSFAREPEAEDEQRAPFGAPDYAAAGRHPAHGWDDDMEADTAQTGAGELPSGDDDFDFDSAFQAELAQVDFARAEAGPAAHGYMHGDAHGEAYGDADADPEDEEGAPVRAVVATTGEDEPIYDSERSLEDHFAAAFAEELAIAAPALATRHAQLAAPDHHREAMAHQPAVPAAAADARHREETVEADHGGHDPHYDHNEAPGFVSDEELDFDPVLAKGGGKATRSFRLAGAALGVALILGLGAVSYGFFKGDTAETEPVVVKADDAPVKIKPEDPGGAQVANQDKAAYERVSGKFDGGTTQEKLISAEEKPVDIAAVEPAVEPVVEDDVQPAAEGKTEERLVPRDAMAPVAAAELPALQPRRVRTLIVRPDGTIVPPAPEPAAAAPGSQSASAATAEGSTTPAAPAQSIDGARSTGDIPVPLPNPGPEASAAGAPLPMVAAVAASEPVVRPLPGAPASDPVRTRSAAPAASSDAPIAIAPQTVATAAPRPEPVSAPASAPAAEPAAATQPVARSEWAIQVSSQRSAEDAEASYRNLRNRFPDLLEGRQMAVQRADIDGKGVFYRVRIQANSREDAIAFCDQLKAAGGSCFATR